MIRSSLIHGVNGKERQMKVSDYVVDFLVSKGITDVFGYPGGMLTHFMDSLYKNKVLIRSHTNYHEQASSFSACAYAQVTGKPGVAFATSGPGATNLVTGICNAYFDTIPTIFITGQVNTNESKSGLAVRQKGFQETDIVSMVKECTKYAVYVKSADDIRYELEKAYSLCMSGRKGPVLLDIPMNVFRQDIDPTTLKGYLNETDLELRSVELEKMMSLISSSKRPCIIAGSGLKISNQVEAFRTLVEKLQIPVVTSMLAFDCMRSDSNFNYGFIGAYGHRYANFIVEKSDLIISLGSRLDVRQVGGKVENFAHQAKLIRVDLDQDEFSNKIKNDELQIKADLKDLIPLLNEFKSFPSKKIQWLKVCDEIMAKLKDKDLQKANIIIKEISKSIPDKVMITTDVGQNQVWVAQSFITKPNQKVLFSGGHAAMGYSLPAAIGAYYASQGPVFSFNGDGGIQMNIQELQFVSREKLPIKIFILNNRSLGMITHFQEMYFDSKYAMTTENEGYSTPDFEKIAYAYDLKYTKIASLSDVGSLHLSDGLPEIIEIKLDNLTYVYPKLEFGKPNQDQEPRIDRDLYNYLMSL